MLINDLPIAGDFYAQEMVEESGREVHKRHNEFPEQLPLLIVRDPFVDCLRVIFAIMRRLQRCVCWTSPFDSGSKPLSAYYDGV